MIDNVFSSLFSLRSVMRHNEQYLRDTAKSLDIFPMDLLVLMLLEGNVDMHHAKDIAKELRCSKGRISESVDRLEKSGLIDKKQVESDRRKTELKVTEKAELLVRTAEGQFKKLEEKVFKDFSEEEMNEFARLSKKLTDNTGSEN